MNSSVTAAREQHRSEIENFETLMKANQDILRAQIDKYTDQMQRLIHSDNLIRQLTAENETLVMAIQTLEDSIKSGNPGDADGSDPGSAAARECLEAVHEALCASLSSTTTTNSSSSEEKEE